MATPDFCVLSDKNNTRVQVHTGVYTTLNYPAEYYLDIKDGESGNDGWHKCGDWNTSGVWYVYYSDYENLEYLEFRTRMKYNYVIQPSWYPSNSSGVRIKNPLYKPAFTPQAPDVCEVSISDDKIYCYTRCFDADIYNRVQYYIDIKDGKPGNDGWHMFCDWRNGTKQWEYLSKYKNLKTIQLRSRIKVDGTIYNYWRKSNIIENPKYEKPKPDKFYGFNNIRTGSFTPDLKINEKTYKVYMMKWEIMRSFFEKINEVSQVMNFGSIINDGTLSNAPTKGDIYDFKNKTLTAGKSIKLLCEKMNVSTSGIITTINSGNHATRQIFITMQEKLNECIDNA